MKDKTLKLDDLIEISEFHKGRDLDLLAQGKDFYEDVDGYPAGCFNLPEDIKFLGLNIYKDGVPRGKHHHLIKTEYTYVLKGSIKTELYLIDDPTQRKDIILREGQMIYFPQRIHHTLTAINGDAIAFEASPQPYDENDYYK